jgi:HEPN domain-containing protein
MKPETTEWIEKAEGNWHSAQWGMQAADPVWDDISFLCQQCGEKYLKAFLREHDITPPRQHDLIVLLNMAGQLLPELKSHTRELAFLTSLSVATRYPGMQASRQDAEDAIEAAGIIREVLRGKLRLS